MIQVPLKKVYNSNLGPTKSGKNVIPAQVRSPKQQSNWNTALTTSKTQDLESEPKILNGQKKTTLFKNKKRASTKFEHRSSNPEQNPKPHPSPKLKIANPPNSA